MVVMLRRNHSVIIAPNVVAAKAKLATKMKDEDFVDQLFIANSHDTVLCFSSNREGSLAQSLRTYQWRHALSRGKPIVNLLPLDNEESINAILPVKEFSEDQFVFMVTSSVELVRKLH